MNESKKFVPRVPVVSAEKFYGIKSVEAICDLANTSEYSLSCNLHGSATMKIAGLELKHQDVLVRDENRKLSVMSVADFSRAYEEMK